MKILVVFYSLYGHIYKMAEAVAAGAREIPQVTVDLRRVPETLPQEVLEKMGALEAQKKFAQIPVCTVNELAQADAVIFGTPTRYGNMCGQMRQFLDAAGQVWVKGSLVARYFIESHTAHSFVTWLLRVFIAVVPVALVVTAFLGK